MYQNANFKWQIIIFIHKKILKGKKQSKFTSQRFVELFALCIIHCFEANLRTLSRVRQLFMLLHKPRVHIWLTSIQQL